MLSFDFLPPGIEAILLSLILTAAIFDIRSRRIPNWLTLTGVLTGLAMNTFLYEGWPGLRQSLTGLAAGFGVYALLYALRAMGAGDVKLMAAIGAIVGARDWFGVFIVTAIFGGIIGLGLVTLRGRLRTTVWNMGFILSEMKNGRPAYVANEELDVRNPKSTGMPHGAVIALGTIVFLGMSAHYVP